MAVTSNMWSFQGCEWPSWFYWSTWAWWVYSACPFCPHGCTWGGPPNSWSTSLAATCPSWSPGSRWTLFCSTGSAILTLFLRHSLGFPSHLSASHWSWIGSICSGSWFPVDLALFCPSSRASTSSEVSRPHRCLPRGLRSTQNPPLKTP